MKHLIAAASDREDTVYTPLKNTPLNKKYIAPLASQKYICYKKKGPRSHWKGAILTGITFHNIFQLLKWKGLLWYDWEGFMNMPYLVEIYFSCEHLYCSLIFFSSNLWDVWKLYVCSNQQLPTKVTTINYLHMWFKGLICTYIFIVLSNHWII